MELEWKYNQNDAFTVWDRSCILQKDPSVNAGMCQAISYYVLKRMLGKLVTTKAILDGQMGRFASMQRANLILKNICDAATAPEQGRRPISNVEIRQEAILPDQKPLYKRSAIDQIAMLARNDGLKCEVFQPSEKVKKQWTALKNKMQEEKDKGAAAVASFLGVWWNGKVAGHGVCMCLGSDKVGTVAFDPNLGHFRAAAKEAPGEFFDLFFAAVQCPSLAGFQDPKFDFGDAGKIGFAILRGTPRDVKLLEKDDRAAWLEQQARFALAVEEAIKMKDELARGGGLKFPTPIAVPEPVKK